jgi:hypothetical protein
MSTQAEHASQIASQPVPVASIFRASNTNRHYVMWLLQSASLLVNVISVWFYWLSPRSVHEEAV